MGIEQRGNRTYYYRKQRIGARVVSEYMGEAWVAMVAARYDASEREKRRSQQKKERKVKAEAEVLEHELDALCADLEVLTQAVLMCSGFHNHKGEWRQSRG